MSHSTLNLNAIVIYAYLTLGYRRTLYGLRQICLEFGGVCLGDFCAGMKVTTTQRAKVLTINSNYELLK